MSLKLLSTIGKQELFFTSAAALAKDDQFEGQPPFSEVIYESDYYQQFLLFHHINFFSCWHMNDDESDAMWKIYMKDGAGIAIQSTVDRLKRCFDSTDRPVHIGVVQYVHIGVVQYVHIGVVQYVHIGVVQYVHIGVVQYVHIGVVQYIDYDQTAPPVGSPGNSWFLFKRRAFRHERELRVGVWSEDVEIQYLKNDGSIGSPEDHDRQKLTLRNPRKPGVYVPVDLNVLIDKIVIAPQSPSWFAELVSSITNRLGYSFTIEASQLRRMPPLSLLNEVE